MFDLFRNTFLNRNRYKTHSEAVIVACFFNPQNSPYRLLAFQKWYRTIKHLNHRIVECLIGDNAVSQLPDSPYITQVQADSLMFHKEALLNHVISELPSQFKYVFWMDTDVLLTNQNWLPEAVHVLQEEAAVVQPFEYCVHLEKNTDKPDFDVDAAKPLINNLHKRHKRLWRSYGATHATSGRHNDHSANENYDLHGHVGFLWGAKREVLEQCPLFDKAVIGGADHVIAHATTNQIGHPCIKKGFADNIDETLDWSREWFRAVVQNVPKLAVWRGQSGYLGFVSGDLYHIWHGDISNRKYLKRIQEFTGATRRMDKDRRGFYKVDGAKAAYMRRYYQQREVGYAEPLDFGGFDADFMMDMGYALADIINLFGQPYQDEPAVDPGVDPNVAAQEGVNFGWPSQPDVPDSTPPGFARPLADGWPAQPVVPDSTPPALGVPDSLPIQGVEDISPFTPKVDDVLPSVWTPNEDRAEPTLNDAGWEPATVPDTPDNTSNYS